MTTLFELELPRQWTWERGRGKRGVGKAVYTVTHNPNGFPLPPNRPEPTDGLKVEICVRTRHSLLGCAPQARSCLAPAVWRVVKHRDHRQHTAYSCDQCLRPDERPGTAECEAANQAALATRRPKLTDADKLHRLVNKIGGVDGIAEGHYAIEDPFDPQRHTTWRVKDGKFEAWPTRVRVGPITAVRWADCPRYGSDRERFIRAAWARQHEYHADVKAAIKADPEAASARFSVQTVCCCVCNRKLTDPESVGYGIGPECRRWMPAEHRAAIADHTSRLRAAS